MSSTSNDTSFSPNNGMEGKVVGLRPMDCICNLPVERSILLSGFQLAQLVKSLVVEQETWVQIPPTPKINWCLGLMVRATIMSGRHRFKFYHNYQKKKYFIEIS
jgi:hypothetical protein